MSDQTKNVSKRVGMYDIVNINPRSGQTAEKPPEDTVQKNINDIVKLKKAAAEVRALEALEGQPGASSPFSAAQEVADLFNSLGMNPGNMAAAKDEEIRLLREASSAAEREVHAMRIQRMEDVEQRLTTTLAKFAEDQKAISEAEKNKISQANQGLLGGGNNTINSAIERVIADALTSRLNPPAPQDPFAQMIQAETNKRQLAAILGYGAAESQPPMWMRDVETYKVQKNAEIELEKMKIQRESDNTRWTALQTTVKQLVDILPDAAAAFGEAMRQDKAKEKARDNGASDTKAPPRSPERPPAKTAAPANDGQQFVPHYVRGECPYCHEVVPVPDNAPPGLRAQCPYCQGVIVFEDEPEKPQEKTEKPVPPAPSQDKADEVKGEDSNE